MIKFENQTNGRYYYLLVETDLFDSNVLVVIRGGNLFNVRPARLLAGSIEAINRKIQEITRIRLRRGYTIVE